MKKKKTPIKKSDAGSFSHVQNLHFNRGDVMLTATSFGLRISMKNLWAGGEPGAPALPHKIIRVALPKGHAFKKLQTKIVSSVLLNHLPEPVVCIQKPSIGPLAEVPHKKFKRSFMLPQKDKYLAAFKLGNKVCRFAGEEMTGLIPVVLIDVWPVRLTKEGLLELVEEVIITVESIPSSATANKAKEVLQRTTPRKLLRQHLYLSDMVINNLPVEKELRKNLDVLRKAALAGAAIKEKPKLKKGITVPDQCDYLIITDDNIWNAVTIQSTSAAGNITAEFQKLANWKKSRGLRTHVAQVKNIVDGQYGDFLTGARDLQEVIRNFLKWFCMSRGVEFVLLGGDVSIIPARQAACSAWGRIESGNLNEKNKSEWKGTYLGMHIDTGDFGQITDILTNYDTGVVIPYDSVGTSNATTPGWYHTTSKTFATRSATVTEWVRVNGPAASTNAKMVWYNNMNMIPTDLYYASLYGSGYSVAGKHDWDHLNNGLYGQHNETTIFDNVEFHADVTVGRASVESVTEAEAFVKKVKEYENWGSLPRPDSDYDRFRAMLFAAATWSPFVRITHDTTNAVPPANKKFTPSGEYSLLRCDTLPPDVGDQLICFFDEHYYLRLNYRSDAKHNNPGWYYAKDFNDLTPSVWTWDFLWFHYECPVPTPWIVVWNGNTSVLNPMYFAIDRTGLDSSITEQESLRDKIQLYYPGITNIERLYTDEADMNPAEVSETWLRHLTEANLKEALNRGPHFVSLTGHGNSGGCAYFSPALVNGLTNGSETFILYADSCLTGQMDAGDCVAEVATNKADGGAVAYIGNTRFSWIGLGSIYREEFFLRLLSTRHLGELNDSRLDLLSGITGLERIYRIWYCFNTHVFGDPEMPVYRSVAEAGNYFIGNWNTDELHDCRCQWVDRMSHKHKVHFEKLQDGLNSGYDGCGFCLRKYHSK